MTAPLAANFDLDTLVAAATAEDLPVDLAGAVTHDDGWEHGVLETADGWIFRFPRHTGVDFEREVATLRRLSGRLPVAFPQVAWTGAATRFMAYRKVSGAAIDWSAYRAAPTARRDAVIASMIDFLVVMHGALTEAEVVELGIPPIDHYRAVLDTVVNNMDWLPREVRPVADRLADEYARTWVAGAVVGSPVVLHNDFHTGNMVFTAPLGALAGIFDFSNVAREVPTFDFRYFDGSPRDAFERLAEHYRSRTGRDVDLAAARVANRIEDLFDAIDTRDPALLDRHVSTWRRVDADR